MNRYSKFLVLGLFLFSGAFAQFLDGGNLEVVKVGNTGFSKGRIDSLTDQFIMMQNPQGQEVPAAFLDQARGLVVNNLVGQELLRLEALSLGLKAGGKQVDSLIDVFKSQFPDENTFQSELAKSGKTFGEFRNKIEEQVLSDKLLARAVPYPKDPTLAEKKKYFKENKKDLVISDTVGGAHILLKTSKGEKKKSLENKKNLLIGLKAQVQMQKASFAMLAAQYSDDLSAKKTGGDLGRFRPIDFGKTWKKALKKLKVGDISEPFLSKKGWHIFMLTEKHDGKFDSYERRIDYNLRMLKEQKRQEELKTYLDSLGKKYGVQYNDPSYKSPQAIGG